MKEDHKAVDASPCKPDREDEHKVVAASPCEPDCEEDHKVVGASQNWHSPSPGCNRPQLPHSQSVFEDAVEVIVEGKDSIEVLEVSIEVGLHSPLPTPLEVGQAFPSHFHVHHLHEVDLEAFHPANSPSS